jgi:thiol-disulfide isomerase/thioredoxin
MGSWGRKSSAALALGGVLAACGGGSAKSAPPGMSMVELSDVAPAFRFDSLDAREVSSAAMRGKPSVITFVTTFDPISQMQVSYLVGIAATMPGVNFALVALQEPSQREIVELYRDAMKVKFPVAMGDTATIAGGGVLGDVHMVPTTIVLARDGKIAWRHAGGVLPEELRAHLRGL